MTEQEARTNETFRHTINTGTMKKKLHVQVMKEIKYRTSSFCWFRGSHGGDCREYGLLGCNAV
jgi:hypothetical protein